MTSDLTPIRAIIQQAQQSDMGAAALLAFAQERSRQLHSAIKLPPEQTAERLADFILRYICHVPDFIEAVTAMAKEAGIYDQLVPLLRIARDYFLSPPMLVGQQNNLQALLGEAYLAHRLLEEINDYFRLQCGIPLLPTDMTQANVIAHELIGEPFANELDQAVLFSSELLFNEYRIEGDNLARYVAEHRQRGWEQELKRWPCLQDELAIPLQFSEPAPPKPSHWH